MPNKCGVVNCKGNYNAANKCRVFKIPKNEEDRQKWLAVLPPRENFVVDPDRFFVCEKHWPADFPTVRLPGGITRPAAPPSIFHVPASCLPSPKAPPRPPKKEDAQLQYFLKKDKITCLVDFSPDKQLYKDYNNILISKTSERFVCAFMSPGFEESKVTVIVENKQTLCSPLVLAAYKNGVSVPLGRILNPNSGLASYSQFFAAVHYAHMYEIPLNDTLQKVVVVLQAQEVEDCKKAKKLDFLTSHLKLLAEKQFFMKDFCFAVESFPHCSYDILREYLVLPSRRKLQAVISSVNIGEVLTKTFGKIQKEQQKKVMLLVDEVKIRPTVAFTGGVLSGMAQNDCDAKATSMLCVMMKCLYRGPSVMVSVTPVHNLTADFQINVVKDAATLVEQSGGTVLGSITDNHKINQAYCKLFDRPSESECPATATHPLDNTRNWYLLYDTVHLLKCIRNNWISG